MTDKNLSLHNVHYNPEHGAFEASARIHECGVVYTYRVHMKTTPQAGFGRVMRGLSEKAREARRQTAMPGVGPTQASAPELRRVGVAIAA